MQSKCKSISALGGRTCLALFRKNNTLDKEALYLFKWKLNAKCSSKYIPNSLQDLLFSLAWLKCVLSIFYVNKESRGLLAPLRSKTMSLLRFTFTPSLWNIMHLVLSVLTIILFVSSLLTASTRWFKFFFGK